ncbi:uncharacterized protein KY384_001662 [Bacidia gigantensis]|uniref:uncharacterized protein n=1 Tax=Bacidia gigantensis TaxID=2732470 RepID=UPI001D038B9E|nr:uncharacterized protein KY384_001662 [Bacidia gigantensis]KAG8533921.1 hypothetical protein KY384_001662 [Bacidia gigantensis]
MGDEGKLPEAQTSPKDGKEDVKILGRTITEWSESPAPDRAMIADHIYWTWYGKNYPKAAPPKLDKPLKDFTEKEFKAPSKRWWIESPPVLQADEQGYLCENCRHIDFEYLVDTTIDGRLVMCSMRTLPIETNIKGTRQFLLSVEPTPRVDGMKTIYSLALQDESVVNEISGHRSINLPQIKYSLVKKWYNDCNDGLCGPNLDQSHGRQLPERFRLINVESDCIVSSIQQPRYVALSYVWGVASALRNEKDTQKDLEEKGSLSARATDVPNAIKDAISLTKLLGEHYLWVDSLCVIQDDPEDQAQQIAAMDLIYSSAVLTIAAASGDTADAYLAGMPSNPRTFCQHIEKIQDIYLANRPADFSQAINKSVWNSRAWTLQERLLSPRVLYIGKQSQPLFPSWSWAGWQGPVECNTHENLSRIEWIENDRQRYSSKEFRYPKAVNQDATRREQYRAQWKGNLEDGVPYYWERDNPRLWFLHPTAPEEQRTLGPNLKRGTNYLVFEAETTEFNPSTVSDDHYWPMSLQSYRCTKDKHIMCPLGMAASPGKVGGYVLVPGEIATTMKRDLKESLYALVMISRCKLDTQESRGEGNPDLLIDSEATTMEEQSFPDRPHIDQSGGHFDQQRYDGEKPWCMYNIMLVEWIDGVAYRLGVGKMHIDAWAQAEATRKIITLG